MGFTGRSISANGRRLMRIGLPRATPYAAKGRAVTVTNECDFNYLKLRYKHLTDLRCGVTLGYNSVAGTAHLDPDSAISRCANRFSRRVSTRRGADPGHRNFRSISMAIRIGDEAPNF